MRTYENCAMTFKAKIISKVSGPRFAIFCFYEKIFFETNQKLFQVKRFWSYAEKRYGAKSVLGLTLHDLAALMYYVISVRSRKIVLRCSMLQREFFFSNFQTTICFWWSHTVPRPKYLNL